MLRMVSLISAMLVAGVAIAEPEPQAGDDLAI